MSATTGTARSATPAARPEAFARLARRPGWTIIAGKEIGDHVSSVRFVVLLLVLGLAAGIPFYFATDRLRDAASDVSGAPALFLALFTLGSDTISFLRADAFVGIVAPLLGLAFSFDSVNGERADGTLPRLLSQPIHRDDVVNGKFAAGLFVIGLVIVAVVLIIAGMGMLRLGIVPAPGEIVRLGSWTLVTFVYVALWLAFGMLLSVTIRRAATSALIGFGVWLVITIFGNLIVTLVAGVVAPISGSTPDEVLRSAATQEFVTRILPSTLYREVSVVLLNPSVTQVSTPTTVGQLEQAQQQIPTLLSLDQSVLLVWPQTVALIALTVACFALAYVRFMRQEVRA